MEHAAIDFAVELEALGITVEDGILRRVVAARLVVAPVYLQTAFQPFQRTVDGDNLSSVAGIEAQRVNLVHVDGEVLVVELTILGEELEHTCKDTTRETEVVVALQGDTSVVRHNHHVFSVAQRDGRALDTVNR